MKKGGKEERGSRKQQPREVVGIRIKHCYTANALMKPVFNALSIGIGLVAAVLLCFELVNANSISTQILIVTGIIFLF